MTYYALQVRTGGEEQYISLFKALYPDAQVSLHFLQRRLFIKRKGKKMEHLAPIFPGYLFAEAENEVPPSAYHLSLRRVHGFYQFLRSNRDIVPLEGRDLETVLHFIKKVGPVAEVSRVRFDQDSRIVVAAGPLLGLEGQIVKVDKRKGRAKVKLDLYENSFLIDLGFEVLQSAAEKHAL